VADDIGVDFVLAMLLVLQDYLSSTQTSHLSICLMFLTAMNQ
jgi:hypothetical protein